MNILKSLIPTFSLFLASTFMPAWASSSSTMAFLPESDFLKLPTNWNLGEASAVEITPEGNIVVFNRGPHALLMFNAQGDFLYEIGQGFFKKPHGLRLDPEGNIWTTDQATHQVLKFDTQGKIKLVLGKRDTASEGWFDRDYHLMLFNSPNDVGFDHDGNIYVVDGGNSRIVKFNPHGEPITTWGSKGSDKGQFNLAHSIVIDKNDHVYIADRENKRIQIFDTNGKYLTQWGHIGYPYVLTLSPDQHLWMTDARAGKILKLTRKGLIVGQYGQWGKELGEFGFAHGISIANDGRVYISEVLNWRLQRLNPIEK